ncbi:hypothetical protein, partial [Dickeya sp. ws52]|uniref:hypothetical protein n=1 Tax=Dickeya sp. ws52 TaxID=2576377 RepID=UPI001F1F625D
LLVVRAMKQQRNYTVYPARNYSLPQQTSPFTRQYSCLSTASGINTPFLFHMDLFNTGLFNADLFNADLFNKECLAALFNQYTRIIWGYYGFSTHINCD